MTDGEEIPNADTIAAFKEGNKILENGTGQCFEGSTENFLFNKLSPTPKGVGFLHVLCS